MSTIKWLPTTAMEMSDNSTPGTIVVGKPGNGVAFHTEKIKIGYYDYLVLIPHSDTMLPRIIRKL